MRIVGGAVCREWSSLPDKHVVTEAASIVGVVGGGGSMLVSPVGGKS